MKRLANNQSDVLRIDIVLDVELVDALVACSSNYPDLSFSDLTRLALLQEALRVKRAGVREIVS
jgi:hypothetical protein